jgi:hypothetical protein
MWVGIAHSLLEQGVPIHRALAELSATKSLNAKAREVSRDLLWQVEGGMLLSRAMAKRPRVFPPWFSHVIRCGEASGRLAEAFGLLREVAVHKRYPVRYGDLGPLDPRELVLWCRLMAFGLESGMPVVPLFDLLASGWSIRLRVWGRTIRSGIREGESPGDLLRMSRLFPPETGLVEALRCARTSSDAGRAFLSAADCLESLLRGRVAWRALLLWLGMPVWLPLSVLRRVHHSGGRVQDTESEWAGYESGEPPIVKIANAILQQAITDHAHRILLEPEAPQQPARVRFEIDGVWREAMRLPYYVIAPLTRRLKVMAGLDIFNLGTEQVGQIRIRLEGVEHEARVSAVPTTDGEAVGMKILREGGHRTLAQLGLADDQMHTCDVLLTRLRGLLIVASPAGEGVTTTQMVFLRGMDSVHRETVLLNAPGDGDLPGATRRVISGDITPEDIDTVLPGLPDVLVLGVVSRRDTWERAAEQALGSLVIAGMQSMADPHGVIRELLAYGVSQTLLADALTGVICQRLEPLPCPECQGAGGECQLCCGTGRKGRTGVFEVVIVTAELREQIRSGLVAWLGATTQ